MLGRWEWLNDFGPGDLITSNTTSPFSPSPCPCLETSICPPAATLPFQPTDIHILWFLLIYWTSVTPAHVCVAFLLPFIEASLTEQRTPYFTFNPIPSILWFRLSRYVVDKIKVPYLHIPIASKWWISKVTQVWLELHFLYYPSSMAHPTPPNITSLAALRLWLWPLSSPGYDRC